MGHRRLAIRSRRAGVGLLAGGGHGHGAAGTAGHVIGAGWSRHHRRGPVAGRQGRRAVQGQEAAPHHRRASPGVERLPRQPRGRAGLNIYGQFAGGAAWLAKAVHDKQAQYGDKQISVIAGDNIGASPLVDGLVLRRAVHDRHQPDERRLRFGRQPRVRQGRGRAPADPERRLPSRRRVHGGALRARRRRHDATPIPGADFQYLSANVVRNDNGETLFPAYGTHADQERQRQEVHDRHHR